MKIDGKEIANKILLNLRKRVKKLKEKGTIPHLAIILIGNDPASKAYVKQKGLTAKKIGVETSLHRYINSISLKDLLKHLNDLNHLSGIHGIIVQRPLPSHIDTDVISKAIDPQKDVDGFHPKSQFKPPIFMAVLSLLNELNINPREKSIVIFGKGETGGKPIIDSLKKMGIKPFIVDSKTPNPSAISKSADIIVSAVGKPNIIKSNMIKKGVILVSIGLHKGLDGKLHGDYDQTKVKNIASFCAPTPGGVGPVNVAMLLKNLVKAAENFSH